MKYGSFRDSQKLALRAGQTVRTNFTSLPLWEGLREGENLRRAKRHSISAIIRSVTR